MVVPHRHTLVALDRVPSGSQWLGPLERAVEAGLNRAARRREWRGGRWAAKRLVAEAFGESYAEMSRFQVIADDDGGPAVLIDDQRMPFALSISHRVGWAAAALNTAGHEVGIDLEHVEARSERFVVDYFTEREVERYRNTAEALRDLYAVAVWSAKESALKCARAGLRRDTRSVEIELEAAEECRDWRRFRAFDRQRGLELEGWWGRSDSLLMTMATPRRRSA